MQTLQDLANDKNDYAKILLLKIVRQALVIYWHYDIAKRSNSSHATSLLDTFNQAEAKLLGREISLACSDWNNDFWKLDKRENQGQFVGSEVNILYFPLVDFPEVLKVVLNYFTLISHYLKQRPFAVDFSEKGIKTPICFDHFKLVATQLKPGQLLLAKPKIMDNELMQLKSVELLKPTEEGIASGFFIQSTRREARNDLSKEKEALKEKGYPYEETYEEYIRFLKNNIEYMDFGYKLQITMANILNLFVPDPLKRS